jgi:hypothetical protein
MKASQCGRESLGSKRPALRAAHRLYDNVLYQVGFLSQNSSMRFPFPRFPAEFEIPDDWWVEAGMLEFVRRTSAYRSLMADLVALDDIEPPFRLLSKPLDWRGFDHVRMVSILKAFVTGATIPPIDLLILPTLNDISGQPFKYRVLGGVHRFYASIAAGFEFLPSAMRGVCS